MSQASELMALFAGFSGAYGLYNPDDTPGIGGKIKGNKVATVPGEVTVELWDKHLEGSQGLGIIPINQDSLVKFGAIDVDDYAVDLAKIVRLIKKDDLPFVPCRSKSGGVHLFVFLNQFYDAAPIQRKLREFAAYFGHGNSELFPKQTKIIAERGDIGQWLNMPYFNGDMGPRYAVSNSMQQLTCQEFIELATSRQLSGDKFIGFEIPRAKELEDGPPCLQLLIKQGFPEGTRNNGLFNLGVYAQKKDPDNWEKLMEEFNRKWMDPPLSTSEVQGLVKSLKKKDFNFKCKEPPICQHCDSTLCRTRKYGIGAGGGMPVMGSLTKLDTDPPIWFIEIEDQGRLELTTEELQNIYKFQKRCIECLNTMPVIVNREQWQMIVQRLLSDVNIIHVPKDISTSGLLTDHLEEWLTGTVQGQNIEEILLGKPFIGDVGDGDRHYFRVKDLVTYLDRVKFKDMKMNVIASKLRDMGAKHHQFNLNRRCVQCWSLEKIKVDTRPLQSPIKSKGEVF